MTFGLTALCSDWLVDGGGALLGELCSPFVFLNVLRLPALRLFPSTFVVKSLCRPMFPANVLSCTCGEAAG